MIKKIYCLLVLIMLLLSCADKKETDNKNSIKVMEDDEYKELLDAIKETYPNETAFAYSSKTGKNADTFLKYILLRS